MRRSGRWSGPDDRAADGDARPDRPARRPTASPTSGSRPSWRPHDDGPAVAAAVRPMPAGRPRRCAATGPGTDLHPGRTRPGHRADPGAAARRDDPLERPPAGGPDRHQRHDDPADLGRAPASSRTGPRRSSSAPIPSSRPRSATWSGCTSTRPSRPIVLSRRREDPDPGARPDPADAARCGRARSSGTPTTTSATARPACSPRSRSATGKVTDRGPGAPHRGRLPRLPAAGRAGLSRRRAARRPRQRVSTHKTPAVRAWLERIRGSPSTSPRPRRPG